MCAWRGGGLVTVGPRRLDSTGRSWRGYRCAFDAPPAAPSVVSRRRASAGRRPGAGARTTTDGRGGWWLCCVAVRGGGYHQWKGDEDGEVDTCRWSGGGGSSDCPPGEAVAANARQRMPGRGGDPAVLPRLPLGATGHRRSRRGAGGLLDGSLAGRGPPPLASAILGPHPIKLRCASRSPQAALCAWGRVGSPSHHSVAAGCPDGGEMQQLN